MRRLILLPLLLGYYSVLFAATPEEALLSAQIQYQNALKEHDNISPKVEAAKQRVETAKARVQGAQQEVEKAETQLQELIAAKEKADTALKEAGRNLDQAWGIRQ